MTIVANPRAYKIPDWFLNRQKDVKDGRFSQITSSALDTKLREDLERLKKIRQACHCPLPTAHCHVAMPCTYAAAAAAACSWCAGCGAAQLPGDGQAERRPAGSWRSREGAEEEACVRLGEMLPGREGGLASPAARRGPARHVRNAAGVPGRGTLGGPYL